MGNGSIAPPFLTPALDGDEWSASKLCRFTFGDPHPVSRGFKTDMYAMEKRNISFLCSKSNPELSVVQPSSECGVKQQHYKAMWKSFEAKI
jgi:hypothetical protein